VPADTQQKFDTILAAIDPAITTLANKNTVSLSVAAKVLNTSREIIAVTGSATSAAAAADEEGFDAPAPVDAPPPQAPPAEAPPADAAPDDAPPAEAVPATAGTGAGQ
jgi:hypothetical protein